MYSLHPWTGWRHDLVNYGLGGGNLAFLLLALQFNSRNGWLLSLSLVGLMSFIAWLANFRRYRTVSDTPTSRIASAPQGYVEIIGQGRQPPGEKLISRISGMPCLWYRYLIERKRGDRWEYVDSGVSHETFGIDDGSGSLLVDPEGAEIRTSRRSVVTEGGYRKTEWSLLEGETIYVLGEHVTLGGPNVTLDRQADLGTLLAEWKKDKPQLLARFDDNRDGEIDLDEWEHVRAAGSEEVDRMHLKTRLGDSIQLIRKPRHGRPFLIANQDVRAVGNHYRRWSWLHLAVVLATLTGLVAGDPML